MNFNDGFKAGTAPTQDSVFLLEALNTEDNSWGLLVVDGNVFTFPNEKMVKRYVTMLHEADAHSNYEPWQIRVAKYTKESDIPLDDFLGRKLPAFPSDSSVPSVKSVDEHSSSSPSAPSADKKD